MAVRRGMLGLGMAFVLAACTEPATQLVVVVDSDLPAADRVSIQAVARPGDDPADPGAESTFTVSDAPGPATFVLPLSFGVVPPGGDATRRVEVVVSARDATDQVVVSRRARTGFVRGQTLRLPMFLAEACRGVECPEGQTCERGACVTSEVPPESLMQVDPGTEHLDGGPPADGGGPSCTPVSPTPVLSVPGPPVAAALAALPATSQWALGADADTETLFAVAAADGSVDTPSTRIALSGSWGLTIQPPTDGTDQVAVSRWGAGESRTYVFNTLIDDGNSSPATSLGALSQSQLDSRGVSALLGGENVMVLQYLPTREAAVIGHGGGNLLTVGYSSDADSWIASRADGGAWWATTEPSMAACWLVGVAPDRTAEGSPRPVPIAGSSCDRVAVAELSDGQVMMVFVAGGVAGYTVLDASLTETGVGGTIAPAATERIALWPGDDGSARVVAPDGSGGILTARVVTDGASPEVTALDTDAVGVDPGTIRSARMGDATAITYYSATAGAMMLTVVCEP